MAVRGNTADMPQYGNLYRQLRVLCSTLLQETALSMTAADKRVIILFMAFLFFGLIFG